jgi:ketosteroid isomerase-like protein
MKTSASVRLREPRASQTLRTLRIAILVVIAIVTTLALRVVAADRTTGVTTLADTEREFAKLCVAKGLAHSFHENFAEEGIGFSPHPVKVREEMAKRPPLDLSKPRAILDWFPVLSDLAESGEMGFNLGPSTVTQPPGDPTKPRHGYFFSIWKKQPDGRFKVVLDIGTDTDGPLPTDTATNWRALRVESWTAPADVSIEKEVGVVRQLEAALGDAVAAQGAIAAYSAVLGTDFRLLQSGFLPIVDKDKAASHLRTIGARAVRRFDPRHVEVARSADFAYSWGAYTASFAADIKTGAGAKPSPEAGYYAHCWRRDASGKWRLVIEVIRGTPAPI